MLCARSRYQVDFGACAHAPYDTVTPADMRTRTPPTWHMHRGRAGAARVTYPRTRASRRVSSSEPAPDNNTPCVCSRAHRHMHCVAGHMTQLARTPPAVLIAPAFRSFERPMPALMHTRGTGAGIRRHACNTCALSHDHSSRSCPIQWSTQLLSRDTLGDRAPQTRVKHMPLVKHSCMLTRYLG